ncbi:alginate export family protein [candidate division KSB1 bacterium]
MFGIKNAVILVPAMILLIVSGSTDSFAQIKIGEGLYLDGYMRYRMEADSRDFDSGTDVDTYSTLRTRLGLRAENVIDNTVFYIMIGDSRTMGYSDPYLAGHNIGPNKFDQNLGVVLAYLEVSEFLHESLTLKIGRIENNIGRMRIFGPGNWNVNGPRTYDGFSLLYDNNEYSFRFFNLWGYGGDRHWEESSLNEDHYLTGLDTRFLEEKLQLLFLWDHDDKPVLNQNNGSYNDLLSRYMLAGYYGWTQNNKDDNYWKFDLDMAYQFGDQAYYMGKKDISAYLATWDLSYRSVSGRKPWFGIGMDITSGDDGSDPGKIKYFTAEYFSKHGLQGHMDYFTSVSSKSLGLRSIILRGGFEPVENCILQVDLHRFTFAENYISLKDGSITNNVGKEIDISSDYLMRDGLSVRFGFDMFFPSDHWKGSDSDPGMFSYISLKAEF